MLSHGTLISWSGYISPIPSNYLSITPAGIQADLSNSFSNVVVTVDPTDPRIGVQTMHVTARTVGDYNSLDDAASAISDGVVRGSTNLDRGSVQYSISSLPDLMGGNPTLFPLGTGPIAPVMTPLSEDDTEIPILRQPPYPDVIPFDSSPPIFQPPVAPGRMSVTPTRAGGRGAVLQNGALPVREADVAPVVTPIVATYDPNERGPAGFPPTPIDVNLWNGDMGPPVGPTGPVPPFLVVPPSDPHQPTGIWPGESDYVAPIYPIDPNVYLPALPVVTPTQTQTTTPVSTPVAPVAPVVTPVTTTTQTPTTTPVAPVVNSTATPAAASTGAGATDWSWLLWLAGGAAALYALSGSSHKTR